jgi:5-hydroxyisourate hydrolase-like protein (transthyretin family)
MVGRVRDRVTGAAAAGIEVRLGLRLGEPDELIMVTSHTDREGLFRFVTYPGFRTGPHQWGVVAGSRFRRAAAGSPFAWVESVVFEGQPLVRTVALAPVTRLAGRVVQAGGAPVAQAEVRVTSAATGQELATALKTDAGGFFTLQDRNLDLFGFGEYEISVPPVVKVSLNVAGLQPASADSTVDVLLRPGDCKSVTILMP